LKRGERVSINNVNYHEQSGPQMSEGRCSHCGDELPADSVGNRCPKCLLQLGLEAVPNGSAGEETMDGLEDSKEPPSRSWIATNFLTNVPRVIAEWFIGEAFKPQFNECIEA
jgi:hypothetical protein